MCCGWLHRLIWNVLRFRPRGMCGCWCWPFGVLGTKPKSIELASIGCLLVYFGALVCATSIVRHRPGRSKPGLDQFPELFMFTLRVVLLTCVGHYLEGRHRYIALQLAISSNTKPGFQSFRMRWPASWWLQVAVLLT